MPPRDRRITIDSLPSIQGARRNGSIALKSHKEAESDESSEFHDGYLGSRMHGDVLFPAARGLD